MNVTQNVFKEIAFPKTGETFTTLLSHKNVRIERIVSSDAPQQNEYCQEQDEWVILLKGKTTLELEAQTLKMNEGDYLFIPAGKRHKVISTEAESIWLAIHIKSS